MVRLADFHLHLGCEMSGHTQPRTENFQDQRVAGLDQFHTAAKTDAQGLEALHFLIVRRDAADDGTNPRWKLIQPDEFSFNLARGCHSGSKISWLEDKSMNPTAGGLRFAVGGLR